MNDTKASTPLVPKVAILERLLQTMDSNYWLYGAPTDVAPNRVERWDLRSMIDYAVLTTSDGQTHLQSYATFYLRRNTIQQCLMEMQELTNWGEWRMWETEKERTSADMMAVVKRALDAEKARAK